MTEGQKISDVRLQAKPIYHVEFLTVEAHVSKTITAAGEWIAKPTVLIDNRYYATCIKLQAIGENIRYTIDGEPATPTHGFQLTSGQESLIPVPNHGISVASENALASIQYQWVR